MLMITPDHSPSLLDAFDRQDEVLEFAFSILQEAIDQRAFPGAAVAVTHHGQLVALKALGRFTYELNSPTVTPTTLFDLASVTKVVATTAMAMILYERGLLDLDIPVTAITPEFALAAGKDSRRRNVTLRMLLAHSSGLPAYEKLFLKSHTRDELLHAAFITPLAADPGTRAEYSDIGFIILGTALERLADEPLDRFCQREIFAPLSMANTTFNPPPKIRATIPPTADDQTFRHRVIQGEVQDENASVLGGTAPHAGLFAPAVDLARFSQCMLDGGRPVLRPENVALFTRRACVPV
jgi:CubicO group peptidase (beta-lactamase class C family)